MRKIYNFFISDLGKIVLGLIFFIPAVIVENTLGGIAAIVLYALALLASGYSVLRDAITGIFRGDFLDEKFLMSIASIGALIIGEYTEGVFVMLFFLLGEYFEHKAVNKSRKTIKELMSICPDEATVMRDGSPERIDAEDIEIGDIIIIKAGERVAVDCEIISGNADIDTSSLTGESLPVSLGCGDKLFSGAMVIDGVLTARAEKTADMSSAARILSLVEDATERKSREENFITAFSKVYTPVVVALAVLLAVLPPAFSLSSWSDAVYRALSFLVISCPCALVISVPMAFFAGIGVSASRGILFKGSLSFSPIAKVKHAVFDKTGTLTEGELILSGIYPVSGIKEVELLELAASAEYGSTHPIARAILTKCTDIIPPEKTKVLAGKGTISQIAGKAVAVGNRTFMSELGIKADMFPEYEAESSVYVARGGEYIGALTFKDTVKPEAREAISMLRAVGASKTYILSGDKPEIARAVGEEIGIDEAIGGLLPEEKYNLLESLLEKKTGKVMYVGDGINDAPSLARADVGVAMGAIGTDSAKENADIIIMGDDLRRIPEAVKIARKTLYIAKANIIMAIGIKAFVLILSALGITGMWTAVFADVGVLILAVLNSMRILLFGKRK